MDIINTYFFFYFERRRNAGFCGLWEEVRFKIIFVSLLMCFCAVILCVALCVYH